MRTVTPSLLIALFLGGLSASAQITVLGSFDPDAGSLCGIGRDPDTGNLWVYPCSGAILSAFSPEGTPVGSVPRPGESANDVDVTFAPEPLVLGTTSLPAGTLLFINGESGVAEIYAVDKATGSVLATLVTDFGVSHVVGGAYHPDRNTFFLVQDNVPGSAEENRIAEVHPASGDTLQTFQITSVFSVSFGDLDVSGVTGHLFVASSAESGVAEFTPARAFVGEHALPSGVGNLSGLALDCAVNEAWASSTSGDVYHLGQFPCGPNTSVEDDVPLTFALSAAYPNPFNPSTTLTLTLDVPQAIRVGAFDVLGQRVALLHDGVLPSGVHTLRFDAGDLPSGLYLLRATGDAGGITRRATLLR
ncbi:MAG TPA: T9SS type A sorting domain-containing protein [Rubricoccaceae bacterium]|nr:T9SS type A sorting domain-containing protein [Rubricoccaceae bacterium]